MSDRVLVMRGGSVVAELESTRTTQAEVLAFALGHAGWRPRSGPDVVDAPRAG
jgi:hypothetical protein